MEIIKEKLITILTVLLHISVFLIYTSVTLVTLSIFYDIVQPGSQNDLFIFDDVLNISILLVPIMFGVLFFMFYLGLDGIHEQIHEVIYNITDVDVGESITDAPIILMTTPVIVLLLAYLFGLSNNTAQEYLENVLSTLFEKQEIAEIIEDDDFDSLGLYDTENDVDEDITEKEPEGTVIDWIFEIPRND